MRDLVAFLMMNDRFPPDFEAELIADERIKPLKEGFQRTQQELETLAQYKTDYYRRGAVLKLLDLMPA